MSNAPENLPLHRSLELMSVWRYWGLLVVDMQGKLLTMITGHERITWNCRRLLDGAKLLGIPVAGTEQYPQGLGPTTAVLSERLGPLPAEEALQFAGSVPRFFTTGAIRASTRCWSAASSGTSACSKRCSIY